MISFPRLPSTSDKTVSAAITSSKPIAITCSLLMGSCSSAIVLTSILINLININAMTWITAHEAVELTGVRIRPCMPTSAEARSAAGRTALIPAAACITVTTWSAWRDASAGNAMPPRWPAAPWNGVIRSCRPPSRRCGMAACGTGAPMPSNWPARVSWKISRPSCGDRRCKRGSCRRAGRRGAASWRSRGHTAGHRGDGGTLCRRPAHAGPVLGALRAEARGVLATLVVSMFGSQALLAGGSISQQLAAAWKRPRAEPAIRQALCLLADHELNASTFATRVTISTGASLSAGILSGLATLTGPLHGRAAMSLKPLIDAMAHADAESLVRERLHMGLGFPAFGHLVSRRRSARRRAAGKPGPAKRLCRPGPAGRAPGGRAAEHRFRTGGAERRAPSALACPLALFAIGRCVGWLAHALEQAGSGQMIRPRARYVGVPACRAARRIGDPERRQAAPERRGLTAPAGWQSRTQRRHVTLGPSSSNRSLIS